MADIVIPEFMDHEAASLLLQGYDVHFDHELWRRRPELFYHLGNARAMGALFEGLDNIILPPPHVAGVTQEANRRIGVAAVNTIRRMLGAG